jgi:hypothetical protein
MLCYRYFLVKRAFRISEMAIKDTMAIVELGGVPLAIHSPWRVVPFSPGC